MRVLNLVFRLADPLSDGHPTIGIGRYGSRWIRFLGDATEDVELARRVSVPLPVV